MDNYGMMDTGGSMAPPPPQMGYGMMPPPSNDASIAGMRWQADQIVYELYKRLGGYDIVVQKNGVAKLERDPNIKAKLNDDGIQSIISLIQAYVNPVVALSNLDDEEANELIRQVLYRLAGDIVLNKDRFDIHDGDMGFIMNIVKGILFTQLKRAVSGHESRNFHTQTVEQNVQQHTTQNGQSPTFGFLPMSFGRRR